jgi:2-methylisocitrate lyase-like PEP mutase family enzyme
MDLHRSRRSAADPEPVGRRLGDLLASLGFEAFATTSSGCAATLG